MKHLSVCLITLIYTCANALSPEPQEFQGLSSGEQAAGCQIRFAANVDYLLQRADAATDPSTKQDMTKRAVPVAGMSILAGQSAGKLSGNSSERIRRIGAFDPGSTRHDIGGYCMAVFLPSYLQYSKETTF